MNVGDGVVRLYGEESSSARVSVAALNKVITSGFDHPNQVSTLLNTEIMTHLSAITPWATAVVQLMKCFAKSYSFISLADLLQPWISTLDFNLGWISKVLVLHSVKKVQCALFNPLSSHHIIIRHDVWFQGSRNFVNLYSKGSSVVCPIGLYIILRLWQDDL